MATNAELEAELDRLRRQLQLVDEPDPVDVAVVEALGSSQVQDLLVPVLDEGAYLVGATLEAAGSIVGVVELTFECQWMPGTSHLVDAPSVGALVEVSPPRVLTAQMLQIGSDVRGVRFSPPAGRVPPALSSIPFPSATEALQFNQEMNRSFDEWVEQAGLARKPIGGTGGGGFTTGTKCTSLLCFERTRDDTDWPAPRPSPPTAFQ